MLFAPMGELVGVGVARPAGTDPLESSAVAVPMQRPFAHVVVGGAVDNAWRALTGTPIVDLDEKITGVSDQGVAPQGEDPQGCLPSPIRR